MSEHHPDCGYEQAVKDYDAFCEKYPNHCRKCWGSGIGQFWPATREDPEESEPCEHCIMPPEQPFVLTMDDHSREKVWIRQGVRGPTAKCPLCATEFPEDDEALEDCQHCEWECTTYYGLDAPQCYCDEIGSDD